MIERYTLPEMAALWNEEAKFRAWLRVELAVCRARAFLGEVPAEEVEELADKADFTTQRIQEIEEETNHDVIAFVTAVSETVALADSRHRGFVNAVLRRLSTTEVRWPAPGTAEATAISTGLAPWAVQVRA